MDAARGDGVGVVLNNMPFSDFGVVGNDPNASSESCMSNFKESSVASAMSMPAWIE